MSVNWGPDWPTLTLEVFFDGFNWEDISDYVRECYIERLPSRETGRYPAAAMTVTLSNLDARFSPFNLSGPYVSGGATEVLPDKFIRLTATWDSVTYNLFCGLTEDWQDEYPEAGTDAVTVVTCVDPLAIVAATNRVEVAPEGAGELSGDRIDRILTPIPVAVGSLAAGNNAMQATTLDGNALDECYLVVDSEGGAIWYDPTVGSFGGVVFDDRSSLVTNSRSNTSQVTFGDGGIGVTEFTTTAGRDQIVREATFTVVGGTPQTAGSGTPSIKRTVVAQSDTEAAALAELAIAVGDPAEAPRVTSATVAPMADPTTAWPHVLGRRIRDRATVDVTIRANSLTINRDVFIDGVRHAITPLDWRTTFEFASASAWDAFNASLFDVGLFDDAVFFF